MKYREPGSLDDAFTEAAALIGWERMAEVCGGRSARMVRWWGDPDYPEHQAPVTAILAIDRACLAEAGRAPLLEALQRIEAGFGRREVERCVVTATLDAVTAVGRLTEAVREARAPQSPGGERLSLCERHALAPLVRRLKRAVEGLEDGLGSIPTDPQHVIPIQGRVS